MAISHADLLAQAAKIAAHYGNDSEQRLADNEWLTCCPVHEDRTPSFHITVTDKLLVKCMAGCNQRDVIEKIKRDGLWVYESGQKNQRMEMNIPPHKEPDWDSVHVGRDKPTAIYTYTDENNRPLFWVLRLDTEKGKKIMPYSSVRDTQTGKDTFAFTLQMNRRPMYNLYSLIKRPEAPVLVVEGEKACDAAQEMFPNYVCVTWAGGAGGVRKTDFSPLANRKVTLCPDNDETGIEAMTTVAIAIKSANDNAKPYITFMTPDDQAPKGWDFADDYESDTYSPYRYLDEAIPFDYEARKLEALSTSGDEWIEKFNEKYVAVNVDGNVMFFNIQEIHDNQLGAYPFIYLRNETALRAVERFQVYDVNQEKYVKVIDYWIYDPNRPVLNGLTYSIENNDRIVDGKLNTFTGFATKPTNGEKYKPFVDHIYNVLTKEEADFLLDWLAQMVQKPQAKPGTMIILTGKPGTGKTIIGEIICEMLGMHSAIAVETSSFTDSSFNQMFARKVFVLINEFELVKRRDTKFMSKLKAWVTDAYYSVNPKGAQQYQERSYHRYLATTNSNAPMGIDINDRRYVVMEVINEKRNDYKYFEPLVDMIHDHEALSDLHGYLKQRDVTMNINKPIMTEAKAMTLEFENPIDQFMYEVLQNQEFPSYIAQRLVREELDEWREQGILVPRPFISDYFTEVKKLSISFKAINDHMRDYAEWENGGNPNNQKRMDVFSVQTRSVERIKTQVWEFKNIKVMRARFEKKHGNILWTGLGVMTYRDNPNVVEVPFGKNPKEPF